MHPYTKKFRQYETAIRENKFCKAVPFKNHVMDFITYCLRISSYFGGKVTHDEADDNCRKKRHKRSILARSRVKTRKTRTRLKKVGYSFPNLNKMVKELSYCIAFCLLQVSRQHLECLMQNMWGLFISMEVWGYICNSMIDTLHELQKQITLLHDQAFYMWELAEIPRISPILF